MSSNAHRQLDRFTTRKDAQYRLTGLSPYILMSREMNAEKLAKVIGGAKAAKELRITKRTIHTWLKTIKISKLDMGEGSHTPATLLFLNDQLTNFKVGIYHKKVYGRFCILPRLFHLQHS